MVVAFGEIMMRLSPPNHEKFLQSELFKRYFGGAEANVAIALAQLGEEVRFVTVLPENDIGKACFNEVRKWGVDTSKIIMQGQRLGIYFCENGASQRASKVIYDRKNSAIAEASSSIYNWAEILKKADWFHFSGITPALSENAAKATLDAVKMAKEMGITVSCDLNYRRTLWSADDARETMSKILPYVDVLITNEYQLYDVFSVKASSLTDTDKYCELTDEVRKMLDIDRVYLTIRNSQSASKNDIWAVHCKDKQLYTSKKHSIEIVDRVGGGDAFSAGLIYAIKNDFSPKKQLDFAISASCLAHTVEGDFSVSTKAEIEEIMGENACGLIQR
ncbi:MAG: sugar kinase [Oscillospiraceae bacterium]